MTSIEIPDYEDDFRAAVADSWNVRDAQTERQRLSGKVDAGTRGAVTGGKHMDAIARLIARVMVDAGLEPPAPYKLPGYYRRNKNWDLVALYGPAIGAVVELKSQVGSIGNNANNRIEEMIGQSVDFWKANEEDLLGPVAPWFGYLMMIEDSDVSRRIAAEPRTAPQFPTDPIFRRTDYIDRYAIALGRLRLERQMDQVCLIAADATGMRYPDPTMSFTALATAIHARGLELRGQFR